MNRFFIVMWLFLQPFAIAFTQQNNGKSASNTPGFRLFFEKAYLHLDRDYYAAGDDIWFKAYLVNGQSNWLTNSSNNLYVELISPDSKLLTREVIHLDYGTGAGDFKLKDSIPNGKYRIRAYTNWMRNFGDCFIFEKEIEVHSTQGIKSTTMVNPDSTKIDVQFFPEGGSLITNVASIVAFKAVDLTGKGCEITGQIVSSKGDTVTWFQSIHLGMGTFNFLPIEGEKYYAVGKTKNGISFRTDLPAALSKGFAMRVNNNDTASFLIGILTNQQTLNEYQNQEIYIVGKTYGKKCYSGTLNLIHLQTAVKIPKSEFPEGIACITLFDSKIHPFCERLLFIEKKKKINLTITSDKKVYNPRETVTLTVKASDAYKQPVQANLSLSVLDASQVPERVSNITSYLMLESEVKGKIENPVMYFDTTNTNRYKQLNLLLLTQGWRDFLWKRLDSVRLKYMVEPGITVSGRVRQKLVDKPIPGANITFFMPEAKRNKLLFTQTDSMGRYFFDGVEFYGWKHVLISSKGEKGKNAGWILRDSLFIRPAAIQNRPNYKVASEDDIFANEADSRHTILKPYQFVDTVHLDAVVITGNKQKEEDQMKKHIIEGGGTADYDLKITEEDYTNPDIGAYLMAHVPGADYLPVEGTGDKANWVGFRSAGKLRSPRYVLDGFNSYDKTNVDLIYSLPLYQIERIIISRKDVTSVDEPDRFVISIFTNPDAVKVQNFSVVDEKINGYYEPRTFYSPKYDTPKKITDKPDLRPTIYWNPKIVTDGNGNASVTFYNSDKPSKINIVIEGISNNGMLFNGANSYRIK